MLSILFNFFQKKRIDTWAPLSLSSCTLTRPYLLEREGILQGTVVMIAIPYYTHDADLPARNLSAYAVPKDYHAYFRLLFDELLSLLRKEFPQNRFCAFADHSPIDEREAAARAGLGILGDNNLLITKKYSSFIFLGELCTDLCIPCREHPVSYCEHCGACAKACPMSEIGTCLSALTQKKGELSNEALFYLLKYQTAWGCDLCQAVCPHTKKAIESGTIYTPIPYFQTDTLPILTSKLLTDMPDEDFLQRAFSWRGKEVVLRNLQYLEEHEKGE